MNAKQQLIANKPLREWWLGVTDNPLFDQLLLHVKAMTMEAKPSPQQLEGVSTFIETLQTIAQTDAPEPEYPEPGINHNLEIKRKTIEKTPEQK